MRLSVGAVIVLALLPMTLSVIGFYAAHFVLSAPKKVEWVSLGAPPGGAVEFVDQKSLVRGVDGMDYWFDGSEWILSSDEVPLKNREFDEGCPAVVLPSGTVDMFQDCRWYSDNYYAIHKDGTVLYYTSGGDEHFKDFQYVGEFIVKVVASVIGLAFGVGILALVGILGMYLPDK